jgi:hypothetical protein
MGSRKLSRRQFVATVTSGAGTLMLGNVVSSFKSSGKADPFNMITLGKTGIKTTFLGMAPGQE